MNQKIGKSKRPAVTAKKPSQKPKAKATPQPPPGPVDVYILRHAIAAPLEADMADDERALTSKGRRRMKRICYGMEELELSFDAIVSSPLVRARQTAELVALLVGSDREIIFCDELKPGSNPHALLAALRKIDPAPKSVLLVGHEPHLSDLTCVWLSGSHASWMGYRKGGLCKLTVPNLQVFEGASLQWLLTPRQMMLMA